MNLDHSFLPVSIMLAIVALIFWGMASTTAGITHKEFLIDSAYKNQVLSNELEIARIQFSNECTK